MFYHYRRNADEGLRELERRYQAEGSLEAWQRLNFARARSGLSPIINIRMFAQWLEDLCRPNFDITDLGPTNWRPRTQFPAYKIKVNILSDSLPIVPRHRGHYLEVLEDLREIAYAILPHGFYGLIDSGQEFRYRSPFPNKSSLWPMGQFGAAFLREEALRRGLARRQCLDCRNSATVIEEEVDMHGDGVEIIQCDTGCGEFEVIIPQVREYPKLYVVSKEILGLSNDPDPDPLSGRTLPGGARLIMDQWMIDEDPRAFFEVERQRGSYPTKIVMGTKKGTAWVGGRLMSVNDLRSTHYAHYRYDVGPDEDPISFGQGNYDLYPPEIAIEDYTRRLLKLYRSHQFELILDEII